MNAALNFSTKRNFRAKQIITDFLTYVRKPLYIAEDASMTKTETIEKSIIWQTTLKQANELLELKSWNTFVRKLIQEVQSYTEEILQEIQTETAAYRYEKMLQSNPILLQRLPLKYLASYFGIAPQSLSRIRKKIISKDRT